MKLWQGIIWTGVALGAGLSALCTFNGDPKPTKRQTLDEIVRSEPVRPSSTQAPRSIQRLTDVPDEVKPTVLRPDVALLYPVLTSNFLHRTLTYDDAQDILTYLDNPTEANAWAVLDGLGTDYSPSEDIPITAKYDVQLRLLGMLNSATYERDDGQMTTLFDPSLGEKELRNEYINALESATALLADENVSLEYRDSQLETLRQLYMQTVVDAHTRDVNLKAQTHELLENYLNDFTDRVLDYSDKHMGELTYALSERLVSDIDKLSTRNSFTMVLPYLSERDTSAVQERIGELRSLQAAYPDFMRAK